MSTKVKGIICGTAKETTLFLKCNLQFVPTSPNFIGPITNYELLSGKGVFAGLVMHG